MTEFVEGFEDWAGAHGEAEGVVEKPVSAQGGAGAGDGADAFNLDAWIRANLDIAVSRFYFTLTGGPDGLADVEIPISSFQCRLASGQRTYLSVVIPGTAHALDVAARPNGELVVDLAWVVRDVESLREEFVRAALARIDVYDGSQSKSIVLHGYADPVSAPKSVALRGAVSKTDYDGKLQYQVAVPDMYLRPDDTATIDGESFTVGEMVYSFSPGNYTMHVMEAE
jgi:hypothetical protein